MFNGWVCVKKGDKTKSGEVFKDTKQARDGEKEKEEAEEHVEAERCSTEAGDGGRGRSPARDERSRDKNQP